jgi:hypothetical protein
MFANHRSRIQGRFGDINNKYMLMNGAWQTHNSDGAALDGEVKKLLRGQQASRNSRKNASARE